MELSLDRGRVTLTATEVPLGEILAEWSRIGGTRFVDADQLTAPPMTLQLVDVPEADALRILLRAASGYVAAPRATEGPGTSRFDRVVILVSSPASSRVVTRRPDRPGAVVAADTSSASSTLGLEAAWRGDAPGTATPETNGAPIGVAPPASRSGSRSASGGAPAPVSVLQQALAAKAAAAVSAPSTGPAQTGVATPRVQRAQPSGLAVDPPAAAFGQPASRGGAPFRVNGQFVAGQPTPASQGMPTPGMISPAQGLSESELIVLQEEMAVQPEFGDTTPSPPHPRP